MERRARMVVAVLLLGAAGCMPGRGHGRNPDPDRDGIISAHEGKADVDGDGEPNDKDEDSDGDGLPDAIEAGDQDLATPPVDTDQDGTPDFLDLDSDADGLLDEVENLGPDGVPATGDETDPLMVDSDADGYSDAGETQAGSSPNDPLSLPQGLYVVLSEGESATFSLDFQTAIPAVDIVFVMDSTSSMYDEINVVRAEYAMTSELVASLVPDPAFGVAEFRDYGEMDSSGERPFTLLQPVTEDHASVMAGLERIVARSGGGAAHREAIYEALYQVATGKGFDENGDQMLGPSDVPPFIADETDVFGGMVPGVADAEMSTTPEPSAPGAGFRAGAYRVVIMTTDASAHDPEKGWSLGNPGTPPAGPTGTIAALQASGVRVMGIATGPAAKKDLAELATTTGALADLDDDGMQDDPLVYVVGTDGTGLGAAVTDGILRMLTETEIDVSLKTVGDKWGFVAGVSPAAEDHVVPGIPAHFDVTLTNSIGEGEAERAYGIAIELRGSSGVALLDDLPITIIIPRRQP